MTTACCRLWLLAWISVGIVTGLASYASITAVQAAPVEQEALPKGSVVALQGTPHLWIADEQGILHWAAGTRALTGREVDWTSRREVTLEVLQRLPRGDPWLPAGLLRDGDALYLVTWDTEDPAPVLLLIPSLPDVELLGINAANLSGYVLDRADWEQRYGIETGSLLRAALAPAPAPEAPGPALPAGPVLLSENFDDPARGVLPQSSSEPALWLVGYQNGEYVVSSVDPFRSGALGIRLPNTYTDAMLAVDARLTAGLRAGYIALACRAGAGHYRLTVHPDSRSFALARWDGGTRVALVDWRVSPAIKEWSQTNRLELSCAGSTITARVNGVPLASVQDGTYREGGLWIGAGAFRDARELISARFDNLLVTRP